MAEPTNHQWEAFYRFCRDGDTGGNIGRSLLSTERLVMTGVGKLHEQENREPTVEQIMDAARMPETTVRRAINGMPKVPNTGLLKKGLLRKIPGRTNHYEMTPKFEQNFVIAYGDLIISQTERKSK